MASSLRHVNSIKKSLSCFNCFIYQRQVNSHGLHTQFLSHPRLRQVSPLQLKQILSQSNNRRTAQALVCAGVRNNSTVTTQSLPDGYIPEAPPIPDLPSGSEDLVQQLTALGEPTLSSLGLANYTPSGVFQMALEALHVSADIPWWGAIVAATVVLRICVFPLVILSQKNAANMNNHMPTVQRLQEKFTKARSSGNSLEAARIANEMMEYMKRNKVHPLKSMMVPLAQLPVFLSVFVGLRQMANLPVQSMTTGGVLWFTDLTMADPFYALPVMTMATFFLTIELGVDGLKADTMTPMMRMVMRGMPIFIFPFILNFPSAMLCYWFTSNVFSLCQVLMLKIPRIRTALKIPELVKHEKSAVAKKKSFREGFQESWQNSKLTSQMVERERLNAMRFKEAGSGPLQKTYPYDPTKQKGTKS